MHYRFTDKAAEQEFLRMLARKQMTAEELQVVRRLIQEKQLEMQKFSQALDERFGIKGDSAYEYDASAMTINRVQPGTVATNAAAARPPAGTPAQKTKHLQLKDKPEEQQFLRLVASKRLTANELDSLRLIEREKGIELAQFDQALLATYSVSKDRSYQYDAENSTLYELMPMPAGAEPPKDAGELLKPRRDK